MVNSSRTLRQPQQSRSHHVSSRSLVRSALNTSSRPTTQPPTFLLPFRAKLHQAATQQASPASHLENTEPELPPTLLTSTTSTSLSESNTVITPPSTTQSLSRPLVLSKSLQGLLPNLIIQKPHYLVAHVHRFPYLLTEGDIVRLPFHMHGVSPGDILRFNRASILGSREYTLKAGMKNTESYDTKRTGEPNYIDERLFECRMRVMGLDSNPMMDKEKKKRRNRHRKVVHSKHKYTVLRVMEIKIKDVDELKREKGTLLLEGAAQTEQL
ncbi:hypothetical protein LTS07_000140 [Exophiala sideris]|uniref:Aconitate hydratase n=1 Tax=Exophiala sideris TaxID=1016849 RepID=A0ABR0JPZ3_9EURO|nr:hypothetical protein LTS07_000140 [Exophiala sideris]KAK5041198.1 hypothetical protein LTR13_002672 [Exophiala sideris]KAK5068023.1 hypothetical protein LTR69_000140 [Exophiala sideris]KAK5187325.1 hypothetical protein LTR44_000140 [Eurotiomycetes sp. CCFEE 6388]